MLRKGCEALQQCEEMISKLGLFSANETKEDISTTNLKYILVNTSLYHYHHHYLVCSSYRTYVLVLFCYFVDFMSYSSKLASCVVGSIDQ